MPETLAGGEFPARDTIVFVTAGVVVASLLIQGLALPRIISWAHLPEDHSLEEEARMARRTAAEEAYAALPRIARDLGADQEVLHRIRAEYQDRVFASDDDPDGDPEREARQRTETQLRLALIAHKRATVVRLRDARTIDDTVLRRIQAHLDLEEVRLAGPQEVE